MGAGDRLGRGLGTARGGATTGVLGATWGGATRGGATGAGGACKAAAPLLPPLEFWLTSWAITPGTASPVVNANPRVPSHREGLAMNLTDSDTGFEGD